MTNETKRTEAGAARPLTMSAVSEQLIRDNGTGSVKSVLAELDAERAAHGATMAKYLALPKVECACHPGVRWPAEEWGKPCRLTALKAQRDELAAALDLAQPALATLMDEVVGRCATNWGKVNNAACAINAALARVRAEGGAK